MSLSKQENKEAVATVAKVAADVVGPPTRVILRVIFIFLIVAIVLWVIVKLTGVILLLVLSIFFAYLVAPLVEFLRTKRTIGGRTIAMPRALAIILAYLIILGAVVAAVLVVLPSLSNQFPEFATQARNYWKTLGEKSTQLNEYFRARRIPGPVIDAVNHQVPKLIEKIGTSASELVTASFAYLAFIPWLVLIPILGFFLLKDVDSFRRSALQMLPRGRWRWRGDEFFQDVNSTLAAYTRAQLTACVLIGVVCSIGFSLLGMPGGLVMGVIAGVFEFVPLVGPLVIAIMATLLALLHKGPFTAFLVLLFLGVLRIVHDYFTYPRLIGQGIHLHPLAVIFAILSGHELAGVAGIFLAIPVVAILTVSYRHWMEHRGSEGLADLLEPDQETHQNELSAATIASGAATDDIAHEHPDHPDMDTTPEDMVRHRPDLTTGELKLPE